MRAIPKIIAKAGRKITEMADQRIMALAEKKTGSGEIEIVIETEIGTGGRSEVSEGAEVEAGQEMIMGSATKEVILGLKTRVLAVAGTTEAAETNYPMLEAEVKVGGGRLLYFGMSLLQDLNTLHPCNTRPCKHLGKFPPP